MPWDREQTTLTSFRTLEEAYEVADAAVSGDDASCRGSVTCSSDHFLSTLLERGVGGLESVAREVHEKLVRHPHVFGDADARTPWPRARALGGDQDRAGGEGGHLPRHPRVAPGSLGRAEGAAPGCGRGLRLAEREWPARQGERGARRARASDRAGGRAAPETEADLEVFAEVGDLLFTIVNVARRLNVDPELALRSTSRRFRARVERAAELAGEDGDEWSDLDLDAQDAYYERAKSELL